jgi:hypothetical protein
LQRIAPNRAIRNNIHYIEYVETVQKHLSGG